MVIIDTNILIEISRNNKAVIKKCEAIKSENICITPVSVAEFINGTQNKSTYNKAEKLLSGFLVLEFDKGISELFLANYKKYWLSHHPSIPDMLIAAVALHYKLPLYTLNTKDFRYIKGLKLV